jgi:hypothetical protein
MPSLGEVGTLLEVVQGCVSERESNAWTDRCLVGVSPTNQEKHRSLTVHYAFSYR